MQPLIKYYRKRFINDLTALEGQLSADSRYLIAVSGGPDSMALATLAISACSAGQTAIAHCDFGLRPESAAEAAFVKGYFEQMEVPVHIRKFDTLAYADAQRLSVQEAARQLRYDYFNELCRAHGYDHILTAHHQEDNAETFLLHLARGSSTAGLAGIPPRNNNILRPLLRWKKAELEEWLQKADVPSMQDKSNLKTTYDRNYLRHEVLPAYRKRFSGLDEAISKSSAILREIDTYITQRINKELVVSVEYFPFGLTVHLNKLNDSELMPLTLRKLFQEHHFSHTAIDDLLRAINSGNNGKKIETTTGISAIYNRNKICLQTGKMNDWSTSFQINPGVIKFYQGELHITDCEGTPDFDDRYSLYLPAAFTGETLEWRCKAEGDRIMLRGGHQKIQDLFTNEKLDYFQKELQPIVALKDKIIWVPGLKISFRDTKSESGFKITFIPAEDFKNLFKSNDK